jgi:GGDEF domain-containing protein
MAPTPSDNEFGFDTDENGEPTTVVGLRVPVPPRAAAGLGALHPHLVVLAGESVGRTFHLERLAIEIEGQGIPVTVSIGASACEEQSCGAERLISDADAALYRAKREGRNRVVTSGDP